MKKMLSIAQVRALTGWSHPKIVGLIKSGRLAAVNTSLGPKRPTYSIPEESLDDLLTPVKPSPKAQRRKPIDAHIKDKAFG